MMGKKSMLASQAGLWPAARMFHTHALERLSKDKSFMITKPDKCRGVEILNKNGCLNKTQEILQHDSKFKEM